MRRAGLLIALAALAACSSTNDKLDGGDKQKPPVAEAGPSIHERPFSAHFDALIARYVPHGEFPPGVDTVWAPIHSGVNATLYFVAERRTLPRYVNPKAEETFFIVSGSGTLDLADGKTKHVEGGYVVRIPPGFAHGFTAASPTPDDTLYAVLVVSPSVNDLVAYASDTDVKDATGILYCQDVTVPSMLPSPPGDHFAVKRFLDQSRFSTLQLSAIQLDKIPDHRHRDHDETVILFFQSGLGFLRLDEVVNPVQAVQVIHIPKGTVHSYLHDADGQARAVSIFTPGYDDRDVERVVETKIPDAPNGYHKTNLTGDWVDEGGDAGRSGLQPPPSRPNITVGPSSPPR